MRRIVLMTLFGAFVGCSLLAQTSAPPSQQTARQALIEMFLGKGPDDFTKHLPEDARRTLIRKGDTPEASWVLRIAEMGHQLGAQGEHMETFDTGPNIVVTEQGNGHEKLEVSVERDNLMGEAEEIEVSVHYYKDGQLVTLPVVPRITFTLLQNKEVWQLTEVTAAAHIPLTDPDYLKGLRKQQDESNEGSAQMRVGFIVTAENGYAAKHPERGFACSLAALVAPDANAGEEGGGTFFDPGQGQDEWNGYRFTVSGCEGSPASKFRLTAAPLDPDSEAKTFCADESGKIKFVTGGKPSSCFSRGEALQSTAVPMATD
jgi:hypothetical protein